MNEVTLRVAMKALIVNKGGCVLLLREASTNPDGTQNGRYQLPGGRVNAGESFQDALIREVLEETSLQIEIGCPLYVGEWWPTIHGTKNQIIATYFVCSTQKDTVKLSEEHDQFIWISPYDASAFNIVTPEHDVINRYVSWQQSGLQTNLKNSL